jgi:flagellar FliJ protein
MRFSFRLQSLLNWKRSLEESSQMRLAEKIKQLKIQEEEIRLLIEQRSEKDRELNEKMRSPVNVGEYLTYKEFGEDSYYDLLGREEQKERKKGEIEGERKNLVGLMKERKVLERIKEKRLRKFIYQMEKLDQKDVDEMVVRRVPSAYKENLS